MRPEKIVRFLWDSPDGTIIEREYRAKEMENGVIEGVETGILLNFRSVPLPAHLFDKKIYPCTVIKKMISGRLTDIHEYHFGPCLENFSGNAIISSQDNELIRTKAENLQMRHAISSLTYHVKSTSGDDHFQKRVGIETANWGKADKNLRPVVVLDKHWGAAKARD
jgi:hypothetical protein